MSYNVCVSNERSKNAAIKQICHGAYFFFFYKAADYHFMETGVTEPNRHLIQFYNKI